jgi:hypothetical protein
MELLLASVDNAATPRAGVPCHSRGTGVMSYRDDLQAARSRAEAAERALASACAQTAQDAAQLTRLDRELVEARRQLRLLRLRGTLHPAKVRIGLAVLGVGLLVLAGIAAFSSRRQVGPVAAPRPFPVQDGLERVTNLARQTFADAQLVALRATYVDASGKGHGHVQYDFVSPSKGAGITTAEPGCAIGITVTNG